MSTLQRIASFFGLLFLAACVPMGPRTYKHEAFTFTIPAGWQTMEEVFGQSASSGKEYYGLGVQTLVMIQHPPGRGKGKAFFAVASSPLPEGQDLETRFTQAYQRALPEPRDVSTRRFEQGKLSGYEITYKRPWGEPWWQFRDIWLEKDGVIYVLSFHALPGSFATYSGTFEQILKSFQFKD
jgi:hypothetical protein